MNEALADALRKAKRCAEFKKSEEGIQIGEASEISLTEADLDKVEGLKLCADSYIRVLTPHDYWQSYYLKAVGTFEPDYLRIAPWYLNVAVCVCVCAR